MHWIVENMLKNFQQIDKPKVQPQSDIKTLLIEKNVLKRKITWLLTQYEHLRDDDIELINIIWKEEIHQKFGNPEYLTTEFFFDMHRNITRADAITRWRRKIQQDSPSLRGKYYKQRMAKQQEAKEELGYKNEP